MTVRIRKERFIPFIGVLFLLFLGLVCLFIHACSSDAGKSELFGYTDEQIEKLEDMDVEDEVSELNYYTPGLAAALDDGKFTTRYIKYFKDKDGGITDKDIVTAARLSDMGYSTKEIKKLFHNLKDFEITPLLVFDPGTDIDEYIKDCKKHQDNSTEHFELDGKYVTYFEGAKETDTSKGKLMLANKTNVLGKDFLPGDREEIPSEILNTGAYNTTLNKEALRSIEKWAEDSEKEGAPFVVQSGFRTYSTQVKVHDDLISEMGEEGADSVSARPGFSEHQTSYVVDIVARDEGSHTFSDYENTDAFKYTYRTCAENGWIMRYPKGKEIITGYDYESWHYRYLGKKTATRVKNSKMTYDEYYGLFINDWKDDGKKPYKAIMEAAQKKYD